MMKPPRQPIIVSDAVPELDERIRGLRKEISGNLRNILGYLQKQDVEKEPLGDLIEGLRNEFEPLFFAHFGDLIKELGVFHEIPDSEAAKSKKKLEDTNLDYRKILSEINENNQGELDRSLMMKKEWIEKEVEFSDLKKKTASRTAALTTCAYTLSDKQYVMCYQKQAADATIAQQSAHISRLTDELTRAGNLNLKLVQRNDETKRKWMWMMNQLNETEKNLKSSTEEVEQIGKAMYSKEFQEIIVDRDRYILQLKGAQAKMASELGETVKETIKGMDTLSVKFEKELGDLMSRISEIERVLKDVMKWVAGSKTKHDQLMREIARLVKELKEEKDEMEVLQKNGEDEMMRLNQSVKRVEEKKGELEKMIAEKDEQMKELERKMSVKERLISRLNESIGSVISTLTTKMSMG